jgi:catechol 2,3-dioxygenase-like lactoylglutathione lyase family enzyme
MLGRTIPALPVRDVGAAADFWRDRLGFEVVHRSDDFAVLVRDESRVHLWQADDTGWAARSDLAERPVVTGAESFLAGTASCRIECDDPKDLDALWSEWSAAGVLHGVSRDGVRETDFGTAEVAALDLDGNLVELFRWL